MKQFSLEEFKKNPTRKVVTRDGKATARIICTDCKSEYPVIALLSYSENSEGCEAYTADGRFSIDGEGRSDLFFAPEKRDGWVNLYRTEDCRLIFGNVHYKKEIALEEHEKTIKPANICKYIDTIHIEWEE